MAKYTADFLLLSGWGLSSFGAWSIYPPAGYIVGGVLLIAAGVVLVRAENKADGGPNP